MQNQNNFFKIYDELKTQAIDELILEYQKKNMKKVVDKLQKLKEKNAQSATNAVANAPAVV